MFPAVPSISVQFYMCTRSSLLTSVTMCCASHYNHSFKDCDCSAHKSVIYAWVMHVLQAKVSGPIVPLNRSPALRRVEVAEQIIRSFHARSAGVITYGAVLHSSNVLVLGTPLPSIDQLRVQ